MPRRLPFALAILCVTIPAVAGPGVASGIDRPPMTAGGGDDSGRGRVERDEIVAEAIAGSTRTSDDDRTGSGCRWRPRTAMNAQTGRVEQVTRVRRGEVWVLGTRQCPGPPPTRTRLWVRQPSGNSGTSRSARRRLPAPPLATAPVADAAVVKVPMWFWVPREHWRSVSITVTVPTMTGPLSVTTTARPDRLEFDPGDGAPIRRCKGPGTRWFGTDGDRAASACMHTYLRASHRTPTGTYPARLTTVWKVTWRTNRGVSGRAPDVRTHTSAPITVREIQAVGRR